MSKPQLKEKDVNQSSNQRDLEADSLLNKHIFRTAAYGAAGFGVGLAASLVFFKHKAAMTALCAGAGAGYGLAGFASDWNKFKRDQSWTQAQKDRLQRNDEGQGKRTLDQFAFNQFSHNQKHQEQQKYGENQDRKRDEKRVERQKDDNRHHRDESSVQEKSQTKSENQGQQQRQDLKQGQQNKQKGQWKEQPLNPEAQQKQDIAEQRKDPHEANPEPTRMGKAPIVAKGTQDKGKRVEEATHSQSMQGSQSTLDEVQHGERGPQNPSIPPSQRDWKGGHANQGVNQGQVHRGKPEDDRMGKPVSSPAPKTNQDKGSKPENQALLNVDLKGQQLQTFQSNPNPPGKAGPAHEINKVYQEGRNQANDPNLDNWKRQLHGMEQDRMGQSVKEGNTIKVRERSDTAAGVGNYRPGVAEQLPKNQVNADL